MTEKTSKEAASAAARVLRDPSASADAKTAAGSALTQREYSDLDYAALLAERDALREVLSQMVDVAERVDSWQSFPQGPIDMARAALAQGEV